MRCGKNSLKLAHLCVQDKVKIRKISVEFNLLRSLVLVLVFVLVENVEHLSVVWFCRLASSFLHFERDVVDVTGWGGWGYRNLGNTEGGRSAVLGDRGLAVVVLWVGNMLKFFLVVSSLSISYNYLCSFSLPGTSHYWQLVRCIVVEAWEWEPVLWWRALQSQGSCRMPDCSLAVGERVGMIKIDFLSHYYVVKRLI